MTAADWIDDLERKARAATPGPWSADGYGSGQQVTGAEGTIFADTRALHADAEFIAAADPDTILRLIRELQAAERKARTLHAHGLLTTARPAEPTDAQVEAAYRVFRGMTSHPGRTLVRAMLTAALAAPTDTTKEN